MSGPCLHFESFSHYDWSFTKTQPLAWNPAVYCILSAFSAIALWMTIELTIQVYFTFRKHSGLYFYSILITTWGVALHATGFLLKLFVPASPWELSTTMAELGWVSMVTGFNIVLYSRLHLVVRDRRVLRLVLAMIVTDALCLHIPTVTFQYGLGTSAHARYTYYMDYMERIQITVFTIQETIISSIYIWATVRLLSGGLNVKIRKVLLLLIGVQFVVIGLDIAMITMDYCEEFTLKAVLHSWVYAVKLKLEFVVLNQLLDIVRNGSANRGLRSFDHEARNIQSPARPGEQASLKEFVERQWWPRAIKKRFSIPNPPDVPASPQRPISISKEIGYEVRREGDGAIGPVSTEKSQIRQEVAEAPRSSPDGSRDDGQHRPLDWMEIDREISLDSTSSLSSAERKYLGRSGYAAA